MDYVLALTVIYLLAVAIIFYVVGDIVGNKIITRNKIMQRAKIEFEDELTFDEVMEKFPEEREKYKKANIREYITLAFLGVILVIAIYLTSNIIRWNPQVFGLIIVLSIFIAIVAFVFAYKNVNRTDYYVNDNDYIEMGLWSELYKLIKDDSCKAINVFKIDNVNTIACILDKKGIIKNICYYDLTNLTDAEGKLHINEKLLKYLEEARSMARKDIIIDDKVATK